MQKIVSLLIFIMLFTATSFSQTVGLVLSGGGANALAHIGVIKALEENNIEINYITGTSMGAVIGALYASGIPINEIEAYFTSSHFEGIRDGNIPQNFHYYYPLPEEQPIIIPIRFKKTTKGYTMLLPSKIIASESIDIDVVKSLAKAEKEADYNFDNLKIPFRCVAADVVTKELVVYKDGSLTEALRASMSYPFFIRPIKIDGHLMYDGGIYNNFPVDIMCQDFNPDFIIGSNVSKNAPEPSDDDLLEQLQSILVNPTDYAIHCTEGELITPNINFGTFNFEYTQQAIDSGYAAALRSIQHIKYHVSSIKRIPEPNVDIHKPDSIIIGEIIFKGIDAKQAKYAGSVLRRKKNKQEHLTLQVLERNYFRLYQESYIEDIFTKLRYNKETQKYDAIVSVNPIKSITLDLGGNIASRPISEGFAGVSYNNLSTFGFKLGLSTYFGKLYQALNIHARFDFATHTPIYVKPKLIIHNWNWFESRQSNLFVNDKPNYIIEGELYSGIEIGVGIGNKFKLIGNVDYLQMQSKYYQSKNFTPSDTADDTRFNGLTSGISLEKNNLNFMQYAFSGSRFSLKASYTFGNEFYTPGSTSPTIDDTKTEHSFLILSLNYQKYFKLHNKVRFGINLSGTFSQMQFFNNYTSTVIQAPYYKPTPDSRTLFLESFHADKFIAIGAQFVWLPFKTLPLKRLQLRAEGYIFQPYQAYLFDETNKVSYGTPWADRFAIVSGVISFQTPLGPLSFSVNYYYNNPDISPEDEAPVTALLNFGYILFNKSAYH